MSQRNDGGQAYPAISSHCGQDPYTLKSYTAIDTKGGMSLRDYFAAQALALGGEYFYSVAGRKPNTVAALAYEIADAMLKARVEQSR